MGITWNVLEIKALRILLRPPESKSALGAGHSWVHYILTGPGRGFIAQVKTGRPDLAIK